MARLPWLNNDVTAFPDPCDALDDPNGLLAAGGDLSPMRLLAAYRRGIFPWYSEDQPILWWSPDPRCAFQPGDLHVSRSLQRLIRKDQFTASLDQRFETVIENCRLARFDNTWITDDMQAAYVAMHHLGHAHSIEIWQHDVLVGGLYGIAIGRCFFGESMYSAVPNASKVALALLNETLWRAGFALFDCQVTNPHLLSMGAREIPRVQFLTILRANVDQSATWPAQCVTSLGWKPLE